MIPPTPRSTLFPYTTLFRSEIHALRRVYDHFSRWDVDELAQDFAHDFELVMPETVPAREVDRKSTRLNSSHTVISYAVFCLKKKKNINSKDKIKTTTQ